MASSLDSVRNLGKNSSKKSIGLYISNSHVNLVELSLAPGKVVVSRALHVPIAQGSDDEFSSEFSLEKTSSVKSKLAEVVKSARVSGNVISAVRTKDSVCRFFTMPLIKESERKDAVRFEAKKYIPFRLDEIFSNSFTVSEDSRLGNMGVLFVGAKKDQVNGLLSLFQNVSVVPKYIETVATAVIRVLEYTKQLSVAKPSMIVQIENDTLSITIVKQSIPYLIREVSLSKVELGSKEKILNEISLSVDFFKRQLPSDVIEKVILLGNSDLEKLVSHLKENLGVAVELGDLSEIFSSAGNIKKEDIDGGLIVALGLALRASDKPNKKVQVNLLPVLSKDDGGDSAKELIAQVGSVVLVLVLFFIYFNRENFALNREISHVRKQMPPVSTQLKNMTLTQLRTYKSDLEEKLGFLDNIVGKKIFFTDKLNGIAKVLPKNAWIEQIKYEHRLYGSDNGGYYKNLSVSLSFRGVVSSQDRSSELAVANALVGSVKSEEALFKGFINARLASTSVSSVGGSEVTDFFVTLSNTEQNSRP